MNMRRYPGLKGTFGYDKFYKTTHMKRSGWTAFFEFPKDE